MIEAIELTSTRRSRGVDRVGGGPVAKVSFDVYPGQVTALLGAPGSGKSTVLRLMVELEPGGGRTLFGGRPYRALRPAVREVGLALNPDAVHPGRTVQAHLQLYTAGGGVPKARVAEVLEVAGLSTQATVRCGRLDAGQRQRLAIAAALLGDPAALILDEPYALDTHGMSWFHALIRAYAAQGRTVLVAATDPDTLAGAADHVVVLRRDEHDGVSHVIASRSAAEVFDERRATVVQVRSPQAARLAAALETEGARLAPAGPGALQVRGLDRARIGEVAHLAGVCLHELSELSEIGHDDDVFGLRSLSRHKEPLPVADRADGTWRSGVRLVADEIEKAEIVDVAAEASARAVSGAIASTAIANSADAPTISVGAAAMQAGGATATSDGAQASHGSVADLRESAASIGTQRQPDPQATHIGAVTDVLVSQGSLADQQALAGAATDALVPQGRRADQQAQAGSVTDAWVSQGWLADQQSETGGVTDPWVSQGRTADQQAQAGSVTDAPSVPPAAAAEADRHAAQPEPAKPSVAASWRTQGSVAGSRWSAVKGSQSPQGSVCRQPAGAATGVSAQEPGIAPASTAPQRSEPAPAISPVRLCAPAKVEIAADPSLAFPAHAKSRGVSRRTTPFGLRWGRGRSQPPAVPAAEPAAAAAPVLVQPAVPFTVALAAPELDATGEGMTPWRAVAARTSKQSQQASVAEAAPAEQEASP